MSGSGPILGRKKMSKRKNEREKGKRERKKT